MSDDRIGVLLMQMGAPETPEGIRPFLRNLFGDPAILPLWGPSWFKNGLAGLLAGLRAKKVAVRYQYMGGGSPLVKITACQARALEKWLEARNVPALVRPVMRYTPPRADEVISELESKGVRRFLALSLYPQYSTATTESSLEDLKRVIGGSEGSLYGVVDRWGDNPDYIDLMADWIKAEAAHLIEDAGDDIRVLFSAHGLPRKMVERGDPYQKETEETVCAIGKKLGGMTWQLSFQSSIGPVKWLEPSTESIIRFFAHEETSGLLLVPVSFVSDHIETLYDMDLVYRQQAQQAGIKYYRRLRAFNDDPAFIRVLGSIVRDALS